MDRYFIPRPYDNNSPFLAGFTFGRKAKIAEEFARKSGKATFAKVHDPMDELRNDYQRSKAELTEGIINEIRKRYITVKLRKLMAAELLKSQIKVDLKRIVQQIEERASRGSKSKEFLILGRGPRSLNYLTRKSSSTKATKTGLKAFTIEVDVRGYIPDNILVDTENNKMSIRAIRVNGTEKALRILAPSTKALEKVKVHPPKGGILLLQYPAPINVIIPETSTLT